jgi:hypothetical protein
LPRKVAVLTLFERASRRGVPCAVERFLKTERRRPTVDEAHFERAFRSVALGGTGVLSPCRRLETSVGEFLPKRFGVSFLRVCEGNVDERWG